MNKNQKYSFEDIANIIHSCFGDKPVFKFKDRFPAEFNIVKGWADRNNTTMTSIYQKLKIQHVKDIKVKKTNEEWYALFKERLQEIAEDGNKIVFLKQKSPTLYNAITNFIAYHPPKTTVKAICEELGFEYVTYITKDSLYYQQLILKKINDSLLALYPDRVVYRISATDKQLYHDINNYAKKYNITTDQVYQQLGFTVYPNKINPQLIIAKYKKLLDKLYGEGAPVVDLYTTNKRIFNSMYMYATRNGYTLPEFCALCGHNEYIANPQHKLKKESNLDSSSERQS